MAMAPLTTVMPMEVVYKSKKMDKHSRKDRHVRLTRRLNPRGPPINQSAELENEESKQRAVTPNVV